MLINTYIWSKEDQPSSLSAAPHLLKILVQLHPAPSKNQKAINVCDRYNVVKYVSWCYSIADFVPAAIGCNTYCYIRRVSAIGRNDMFIWRIFG